MYKKTVRRRRALLAALVALSLILLTAYFREAPGGGLHAIQRGFLTVISPVEDGASKVFSPVRSAFGSIGNAFGSDTQRKRLERELAKVRSQLITYEAQARAYREMAALGRVDAKLSLTEYHPVEAHVIAESPTVWYERIVIDQGTSSGVRDNDPVIVGEGLVGKVALAAPDAAQVMLITDHEMAVSATLDGAGAAGARGIVKPKIGEPNALLLEQLPPETTVNPGEYVVTAGTVAGAGESLYPRGIPVGEVTSGGTGGAYQSVNLRPLVNLHDLSSVQVLTSVNGSQPQRLTKLVSDLGDGQVAAATSSGGALSSATGEG